MGAFSTTPISKEAPHSINMRLTISALVLSLCFYFASASPIQEENHSIVRRSPQYVGSFAYPSYGRRNYGRSLFSYPSYGGYGGGYGRSFGGRGRRRGGFRRALGTGLILGTAAFGGALIGAGLAQNGGFAK